jgi:TolB protein
MTSLWWRRAAAFAAALVVLAPGCGGSDDETGAGLFYVSTRDGDYAIYSMNANGDDQRRLTDVEPDLSSAQGLFFQVEPAPSPDGAEIAFSSKRSGSFDIYVMGADGSGARRLTSTKADDGHPTWSPDGARLAFGRDDGNIYVMRANGSGVHALTQGGAEESQPAWSPDGRWIAYLRRTPGTTVREVWLVRPDGTGAHRLTSLSASSYSPAWSPQASRVAFSSDRNEGQSDIYTIGVDGRGLRRVTETTEDSFEPSWSLDGSAIAFAEGGSIYSVELGGGEPQKLTKAEDNDSSPVWRPEAEE